MAQPPTPVEQQFMGRLNEIEARLAGLERTQQLVITDPTGVFGDPAHGHACIVTGSLKQICAINSFGLAYWTGAAWAQLI